ncbi:MAG: PEP-CTERM sorting domain-containing protein [Armatimonadetes bacterium]|nr:PEP-CTERM sorting domain-containing protein [Armatimonadota bacterium]
MPDFHLAGSAVPGDEGWGLDDVKVETVVPEPCSLMVLGAGSVGLLLRSRRCRYDN